MKSISWLLAALLLLAPATQIFGAGEKTNPQPAAIEKIKIKVAKLGVGDKARATIKLNDGTRVKGYVHSTSDDDFVIREKNTNTSTTIRYADVKSVDDNRGHSMARNIFIGVGIGAAVVLGSIYLAIARNER
jgi:hypothetical protein